jgi:tetratricopeptide (TPR) repeat protein
MHRLVTIVLAIICSPLLLEAADTFMVRPPGDAASLQLHAFGSQFPVRVSDIQPSEKLTVFVQLDNMPQTDWERVKTALGALRAATAQTGSFRLLVANGGEPQEIKWKTAAQFSAEVRKLTPNSINDGSADWSADARLIESLPKGIEDWESFLLIAPPRSIQNPELREYVHALALHRLKINRFRLSFWPSSNESESIWRNVVESSCGEILSIDEPPPAWLTRLKSPGCQILSFDAPEIPSGFVPYRARLFSGANPVWERPGMLVGASSQPAQVEKYSELLNHFSTAQTAFKANEGDVMRDALQLVLQVNPMHIPALRLAADVYKMQRDWTTSFRLLESLALTSPTNADLLRELGDFQFELKNWTESEKYFQRSLRLLPQQPGTLERVSVIREQLGDVSGAATYVARMIELAPQKTDLHLRHARLLDKAQQSTAASVSFEKTLELDPNLDDVRIRLIEIYKDTERPARLAELLSSRTSTIGNDLTLRMRYAEVSEKMERPQEALNFYTLATKSDPNHEPAHFGRARLLYGADRRGEAYEAVVAGLGADPKSLRLHLMKIDHLEQDDRLFEVRAAIREASEMLSNEEPILRRLAKENDIFGSKAGETYERWAVAMERARHPEDEIRQALERGLLVALRDDEREVAARISQKLTRLGTPGSSLRLDIDASGQAASTIAVPGGIKGMAQAVEVEPHVSSQRFLEEYGRAILRTNTRAPDHREAFRNRLQLYARTVQRLKSLGRSTGDATELTIDLQTNAGIDRAERVLDLLGWRIRQSRNTFLVEVGTDEEAALRQTFGSSLGIDELQMKTRLEQRQTFMFRIVDERAPIIFDEQFWFASILKEPRPRRSLLEEMLENPAIARLYIGLTGMNSETQRAILQAVEPDQLLKRSARLAVYGSSIAIENGRIMLPGGVEATTAWSKLVEASPARAGQFLGNLIRMDDGKMLAYYYSIAVLSPDHQRFFTRTPQRLSAFYKVFPFEDEANLEKNIFGRREDAFTRMARELPLDSEGSVLFPGSERVWTVAKGSSDDISDVERLVKRVRRTNSPDDEDEILLKMLDRWNEVARRRVNQIENFLSVARIDAHRKDPMDELMALTLSQMFGKYQSVFPYFTALQSLNGNQITEFGKAAQRIENLKETELNTALGDFHALIKLLVLLKESGKLPEPKATELFSFVSGKFAGAKTYEGLSAATFDSIERILAEAGKTPNENVDDFLLRALAGNPQTKEFSFDGITYSVDVAGRNAQRMRDVLRLQSISSLEILLKVYAAAQLMVRRPDASALPDIEGYASKLLEIREAPEDRLSGKLREALIVARPAEVMKIVADLKKELAKKKPSKNIPKLAAALIEELHPFLKTTLVGWIYAYYFSPQDLAIANDRYLVRRHVFFEELGEDYWPETRTGTSNGSYLLGGFAQMATGLAPMAKVNVEAAQSLNTIGPQERVAVAQLAAVRSVPWNQVAERSVHLVALKLRLAREFVVRAAVDGKLRLELARATIGLIGPRRRFDLLQSLAGADTSGALDQLSNTDLLFLADALAGSSASANAGGPVHKALERETRIVSWEQSNYFGGLHPMTDGCAFPHLARLAPYEEYEPLQLPDPLAERLSDILLYVAESADRIGLPVQALALLTEPAVRQFSAQVKMSSISDWRSALQAMRAIDAGALIPFIEKN